MAEALAVVNVGNSECGFLKLTPLSRTSAIAGAVSGFTISARKPSGTNRIRLCGVAFSAEAAPAVKMNMLADNSIAAMRMIGLPEATPLLLREVFGFASV